MYAVNFVGIDVAQKLGVLDALEHGTELSVVLICAAN